MSQSLIIHKPTTQPGSVNKDPLFSSVMKFLLYNFNMSPYEKIENLKNEFTKKEMIVYNILQKNPDLILRGNLSDLSEKYNVSQPTITRFCQKIGYQGLNDFKFDVFRYEKQHIEESEPSYSVIDQYKRLLSILEDSLDPAQMDELAQKIIHSNTVYVTGYHKSSLPAQMMQMNLFKVNKRAIFFASDMLHDLANIVTNQDMVIVFSNQGNGIQKNMLKHEKEMRHFTLTTITMKDKLPISKYSDHYIYLPSSINQHFDTYLENQVVFFIFVDLLTSKIAKYI